MTYAPTNVSGAIRPRRGGQEKGLNADVAYPWQEVHGQGVAQTAERTYCVLVRVLSDRSRVKHSLQVRLGRFHTGFASAGERGVLHETGS